MRRALRRLWYVMRQRQREADLGDEMQFHREMVDRELRQAGAAPAAARVDTQRRFGSTALARDRARDVWIPAGLQDLTRDVRLAARLLRKDVGFTVAAVLTLALGIASVGTIFTIFDGMMLKGLPVDRAYEIVAVHGVDRHGRPVDLSPAEWRDWATSSTRLRGLAAYTRFNVTLAGDEEAAQRAPAAYIAANAFDLLGVRPLIGRVFTAAEDQRGAAPAIILGEGIWKERYGGDVNIVGTTIRVNDTAATVVGVMPANFKFPLIEQAWMPLALSPQAQTQKRDARTLTVFGRLAARVTISEARAELDGIAARLALEYPDTDGGLRADVRPFTGGFSGFDNPWSDALLAAGFLLVIGCADVASLLLARATGRARDLAIRTAIGATRWRVVRQLLVESTMLAMLSGCVGVALTWIGVRMWIASLPATNWPYWFRWDFDARVLGCLVIVTAATAVLAGAAPAAHLSRGGTALLMRNDVRGGPTSRRARRWMNGLIGCQLALTMVLLVGAGLMVRTTMKLLEIDSVVDVSHVLIAGVDLRLARYSEPDDRTRFVEALAGRIDTAEAVKSVTVATAIPFYTAPLRALSIVGRPEAVGRPGPAVSYVTIGARYFETLGVHLLLGRPFSSTDGTPGRPAAIVNQRFVTMFFGAKSPIDTRIRLTDPNAVQSDSPALTIVGVSPTIRQHYGQDLDPVVYVPYRQDPVGALFVFARTGSEPSTAAPAIRAALHDIDPGLALSTVMPLDRMLAMSGFANRVFLTFFTSFAVFALLVSAIGLYAATRYTVTARRHEIGVRTALGATTHQVVWLFLRQTLVVLLLGGVAGLAAAAAVTRLMRGFLVATSPYDPTTLVSIVLLLVIVAVIATVLPTRRTLRVGTAAALRCE